MQTQRTSSECLVIVVFATLSCATAFSAGQERDSSPSKANEQRFPVVHAHIGGNCAGYLYVSQESVRYEALVPANFKAHSFQIQRAEILALQPWILLGLPQNVVEIKTAHANYHFWLLPDGMDLSTARSGNLNLIAAPAAELIAAVRNPEAPVNRATQTPARAMDAGPEPSARDSGASTPADRRSSGSAASPGIQAERALPAGALDGIYVGFSLDGSHVRVRNYYFTGDGWVINNIPFVNMDRFDLNAYRNDPSNRLFIGRYRSDGTQVQIVWANNADRRDVIRFDDAAADPGIDTYIPTCRCTGKRFAGRYHWASPTDERYLQFFPNGTFVDHGVIDQVVGSPNPHGYSGITDPPRNFRGSYSITNQKLTFSFADGKQATLAFIAPKASENAPAFGWFGLGHGSGVQGAETVIVLMLYEEHYQVKH